MNWKILICDFQCKHLVKVRITNAGWDLIEGISWAAVHDLKSLSISVFMGNNWSDPKTAVHEIPSSLSIKSKHGKDTISLLSKLNCIVVYVSSEEWHVLYSEEHWYVFWQSTKLLH